jgi:glutathione S-transferase
MAKVKSEYGIERYTEETKRLYSVLESRLKDNGACIHLPSRYLYLNRPLFRRTADWLVDNKYSLADIANFCWVRAAYMIEIDLNEFPGVKKWVDRIEARDAVKKGVKVGASKSPEEMAELFKGVSCSFPSQHCSCGLLMKSFCLQMRAKIDAMTNSDKH